MKVVITTKGDSLDHEVEPFFHMSPTYLCVEIQTGSVEAVHNLAGPGSAGSGVAAALFVLTLNPDAVITGQIEEEAARVLISAGRPVYVGASGCARLALKAFRAGWLRRRPASPAAPVPGRAENRTGRHSDTGGLNRRKRLGSGGAAL